MTNVFCMLVKLQILVVIQLIQAVISFKQNLFARAQIWLRLGPM